MAGTQEVTFNKPGYEPKTMRVSCPQAGPIEVTVPSTPRHLASSRVSNARCTLRCRRPNAAQSVINGDSGNWTGAIRFDGQVDA